MKNIQFRGSISNGLITIAVIILILIGASFNFVGGSLPLSQGPISGKQVIPVTPPGEKAKDNLQLQTFGFVTPTIAAPPAAHACVSSSINEEREFFLGSDPPPGKQVTNGLIRVWVYDDDAPPWVAPGEKVDPTTGRVTTPGDRTLKDRRQGNYIYHPALYITPITASNVNGPYSGDVENGGTPYFPDIIKGEYTYAPQSRSRNIVKSAPMDDYLNFMNGPEVITQRMIAEGFMAQFIWETNKFGLGPGSYRAQFVVHDGDGDLSIDCFYLTI